MDDHVTPDAGAGPQPSRRRFLGWCLRGVVLGCLGAVGGVLVRHGRCGGSECGSCPDLAACRSPLRRHAGERTVWQLDPQKCIQCGRCMTNCVLNPSAVKCFHTHAMCGYCNLCFGYFQPGARRLDESAENQLCPTGAIRRRLVDDPYYEYTVDESLCVGCGKCVKGCSTFGNGSLYLQVDHGICANCNECAIAAGCPAGAYRRVPATRPYLLKEA